MKKEILMVAVAGLMTTAFADNPWRLTIGPAWRARVKSSVSGSAPVAGVAASHTTTYDKADPNTKTSFDVSETEVVQDPLYPGDPTFRNYAYTRTATETIVTPHGTQAGLDGSDMDRPLGLKATLARDLFATERLSFGLGATFAAYWKMRSAVSGAAGGGTRVVNVTKDYYLFSGGPIPPDSDFTALHPDSSPYLPYRETTPGTPTEIAGSRVHARLRSDLYQIGLGPQATWHICGGLDAYGRVQALCNLAHLDFDVGAASRADTKCLFGAGGAMGLAATLAEHLGLFVEVGYEWLDKAEARLGRAEAEVDFSSLTLSAGLVFDF